eukprot:714390-Pleurochrysis_carterae.AAC.1
MSFSHPPPLLPSLSMQSEGMLYRDKNEEMPSGLEKGPENNNSTRRDGEVRSALALYRGRGAGSAASDASAPRGDRPGGCDGSPLHGCAIAS